MPCDKLNTIILVQLANPYNYRCNKKRYIGVLKNKAKLQFFNL